MMSRFLARSVALLLIPCLVADFSMAAGFRTLRFDARPGVLTSQTQIQEYFRQQTLELNLLPSPRKVLLSTCVAPRARLLHGAKMLLYAGLALSSFLTPLRAQAPDSDPQKQSLILQAQKDPDPSQRAYAARTLIDYPDDTVLKTLAQIAANDSDDVVRQAAKNSLNTLAIRGYAIRVKSPWQRAIVYGSGITNYVRHPEAAIYYPVHELTHALVAKAIGAGVKTISFLPPVVTTEDDPVYDKKRGYLVIKDRPWWNIGLSAARVYPGFGAYAYMIPRHENSRWKMALIAAAPYVEDMTLMATLPLATIDTNRIDSNGYYVRTLYGNYQLQQLGAAVGGGLISFAGGDFHTIATQIFPGKTKKARVFRILTGFGIGAAVTYGEHELYMRNAMRDAEGNNFVLKLSRLLAAIFGFNDRWAVLAARALFAAELILWTYVGGHSGLISMVIFLFGFKSVEFLMESVTAILGTAKGHIARAPSGSQVLRELLNIVPYLLLAVPGVQSHPIALIGAAIVAVLNHIRFDWPGLFGSTLSQFFIRSAA